MLNTKIEIENLQWDKVNGLMPAIIQDHSTLQVLMLGYMDQAALQQTRLTEKITFYSRSKKRLWTKGETSGNELMLVEMKMDCDNDTLLILVKPRGPTCHLNIRSCFGDEEIMGIDILSKLEDVIADRYRKRPDNSYVTQLFDAGIQRIAQKVGEEGVEVALASVVGSKENIINESADLIFHLLILLKQSNLDFADVLLELKKRGE